MHFENENVDSIRLDKEFEITLRSMLAQDESRNTSENIQWCFNANLKKVISSKSIRILWGVYLC
jgi:site-specific DNA recombinase